MKIAFVSMILSLFLQVAYGYELVMGLPSNEEVLKRVQHLLPEHPVIIDAGTYDGQDSMELVRLLPGAIVYGFEPVMELFAKTQENTKNIPNITLYNLALSDKLGFADMYVSGWVGKPDVVGMSSSLLAPKEHLKYATMVSFDKRAQVETITIDAWAEQNNIDHVDFIRLDIQGNELNVFMASPKILSTATVILTEVEFVEAYEGQYLFKDVRKWLEANGFQLVTVFKNNWFGDALFIRK